ncbi:MAG: excinuclease ABC subunit UvrA [Anaerolineales bacterium]|nr:excinuclease ABC subunit UvrA [Anaerolineales bacterium]
MPENVIRVVGAKEHNLKNVTVEIPRDKFVVITGLSGSGKSSLAFDTIFAEGQRRYVESLSAYARQFLGQMDKPDVEYIEGLSPAVSIDQKGSSHNPRSTVGTVTEIYDYLRLLYARIGIPHCPICGREVVRQSAQEIVEAIEKLPEGSRLLVLAPVIRGRKGTHEAVLEEIAKAGFVRARINGEVYQLDTDKVKLDRYKMHNIEAVVDRLVIRKEANAEDAKGARTRMTDSVETALRFGQGTVIVQNMAEDAGEDLMFSESLSCPEHGSVLPEIEPRTFSFNTPHGACPECQGLGTKLEIDPELLIPDKKLSFNDGAITALEWGGPRDEGGYYWSTLEGAARAFKINLNAPVDKLTQKDIDLILYGSKGREVKVKYKQRGSGRDYNFSTKFEGVIPNLERRFRETNSEYSRQRIMEFMSDRPCPACNGARLRPEALGVTVLGDNILRVTQRPVLETLQWAQTLTNATKLNQRQTMIAKPIIKEINERLGFMVDVGLDYLTLDRSAGTLSGGEAQRIRLATQIGSRLMGVLYVLDEPSIGLHARDNERLLHTLTNMRDLGNTVLVVEHDEETIRRADWVIDMGPGAGENGGQVVADGSVADILASKKSLTGAYLSGRKMIEVPKKRRAGNGKSLIVRGANENNLKNLDVEFPLGKLICITGVSGSGKSSLMNEIVYKALARELNGAHLIPGAHKKIEGMQHLDKIINIDQSPIGRTPRSNPGTYTGLFNLIRDLFAELPESKARGYKPGRFSFNVRGGRCEACEGQGEVRIEMQFLPDIYVPCEVCHGARFNSETLQVKFKDMSIADVLALSIDRAAEEFAAFPGMASKLETLKDVGLGYIRVGQSAPTLSGGEAQRVKLAKELSKRSTGQTIYVLDEPSVGLHTADVHKLIEVLQRLVDSGNTVLIIEHNMDIIKVADHIIDLGPEGGLRGGELLAEGTPEQVVKVKTSYTGKFLKPYLK